MELSEKTTQRITSDYFTTWKKIVYIGHNILPSVTHNGTPTTTVSLRTFLPELFQLSYLKFEMGSTAYDKKFLMQDHVVVLPVFNGLMVFFDRFIYFIIFFETSSFGILCSKFFNMLIFGIVQCYYHRCIKELLFISKLDIYWSSSTIKIGCNVIKMTSFSLWSTLWSGTIRLFKFSFRLPHWTNEFTVVLFHLEQGKTLFTSLFTPKYLEN